MFPITTYFLFLFCFVFFRATIVQGPAATYWQGLLSNIISYDGPTGAPTSPGGAGGKCHDIEYNKLGIKETDQQGNATQGA